MDKLNTLLKSNEKLFHTQDLALLWGIENKNTLYVTISRYIKKGILIKVFKGLYSTVSIDEIDEYKLGTAIINKHCYVSVETVLFIDGVINQYVYPIVFMSQLAKKIKINNRWYFFKQLKPKFLNNKSGIEERNGVLWASTERAVADKLHYSPRYYFDNGDMVDWKKVAKIQKAIGYKINIR